MNWIEADIFTTTAGIDPVSDQLVALGVTGFAIQDAQDFRDFLEDTTIYWDYVDEELMKLTECETKITVYLPDNPQGAENLAAIRSMLGVLKDRDTDGAWGRLELSLTDVREEDWATAWKKYYHPVQVSERLLICPSWEEADLQPGQVMLRLDPGMAFGTGTHDTTRLCMQLIEKHMVPGCHVLDVGCGSGILSIAALLLGAKDALGVDIDQNAVKVAGENAALNGVEDRLTVLCGDLTARVQGQYELICANIVADVIIRLCPDIPRFLKKDGVFIASGIIDERLEDVREALSETGFVVDELRESGGWCALACHYERKDG
ncbi:50S ribosomal protein L11 methyltransferase [Zongyangia hominis]|uniref:Ribosomal protein L11 methyltransferase n=1 Tax=Zongyangia hominis TaxID=2763677 RepID=A0A926EEQ9_9FIRM|nr:50S ribosomal protein L11 methyltransferase [Zongyangia hominis]MBC8570372.1 50S ribosomal protein L11 methyltransferase [Zongyangia hominis]